MFPIQSRSVNRLVQIIGLIAASWTVSSQVSAEDGFYSGSGDTINLPTAPSYYVVQPGDTLWEISSRALGDPAYWPRLWSINDEITNPHWIYPGNRIAFKMGTLIEPPSVELEATETANSGYVVETIGFTSVDAECGPDIRFNTTLEGQYYSAPAFLSSKDDLMIYGVVDKAKPLHGVLHERDLIYLKVEDPDAFDCGDVVTLFRLIEKKVRHPKQRRLRFGNLYRVTGVATVVHRYEDVISAVIQESYSEVARGDLVGPEIPIRVQVDVTPPDGTMEATLVSRLPESSMATVREPIFIDRGRADGIRVGNTFFVIEQKDGNRNPYEEDLTLPPAVIGRVVIVRVDEYSSTAVVTDAQQPLYIGARLTMDVE